MIESMKLILGVRPGCIVRDYYVVLGVNEDEGVMAVLMDSYGAWRQAMDDHSGDREVAAVALAAKHADRIELTYLRYALEQKQAQLKKEVKGALEGLQYGIFAVSPDSRWAGLPNTLHHGHQAVHIGEQALKQLVDIAHKREEIERLSNRIAKTDTEYFKYI
jgi:transposase